jgi:hypothetical protein
VYEDVSAAAYAVEDWLEWSDRVPAMGPRSDPARAVVEVRRRAGGGVSAGSGGGEMRLGGLDSRLMRVGRSSEMTLGLQGRAPVGSAVHWSLGCRASSRRGHFRWSCEGFRANGVRVVSLSWTGVLTTRSIPRRWRSNLTGGLLMLVLLARLAEGDLDVAALGRLAF